jgi:hypothetical protein
MLGGHDPWAPLAPDPSRGGDPPGFIGLECRSKDQKPVQIMGRKKKESRKKCGVPPGAAKVLVGGGARAP